MNSVGSNNLSLKYQRVTSQVAKLKGLENMIFGKDSVPLIKCDF